MYAIYRYAEYYDKPRTMYLEKYFPMSKYVYDKKYAMEFETLEKVKQILRKVSYEAPKYKDNLSAGYSYNNWSIVEL